MSRLKGDNSCVYAPYRPKKEEHLQLPDKNIRFFFKCLKVLKAFPQREEENGAKRRVGGVFCKWRRKG